MAGAGHGHGWKTHETPLSDGGDGLIDVLAPLGGEHRTTAVEGPDGTTVEAEWLLFDGLAVVEMATASGLVLAGGADANDVMGATTRGTGQLMTSAARALVEGSSPWAGGTPRLIVGLGGSATTDGGLGALVAIDEAGGLPDVDLVGACDVQVGFDQAVSQFARQKGATDDQLIELAGRFDRLANAYRDRFGVDVSAIAGTGAAGGLGAALVVLGGRLRSGYEVVAGMVDLDRQLADHPVIVTGEGSCDSMSFAGKVVGSVLQRAAALGLSSVVVAGRVDPEARRRAEDLGALVLSLIDLFGEERSVSDTEACIQEATAAGLARL
jgi:glycerate kinase